MIEFCGFLPLLKSPNWLQLGLEHKQVSTKVLAYNEDIIFLDLYTGAKERVLLPLQINCNDNSNSYNHTP